MFADAAEIIGSIYRPQRWAAELCRLAVWATIAAALFLIPAAANAQQSGSAQARAEWAKIQAAEAQLAVIEKALIDFEPRASYCRAPHPDDKSTDAMYLDSLRADAEAELRDLGLARTALMGIFARDQIAKAAIDGIRRGAADSIVDGSIRRRADALKRSIDVLHKAKREALRLARERPCGGGPVSDGGGIGVTGPVVIRDPLAGVQIEPPAVASGEPAIKRPFCTLDEKHQALAAVHAARVRAGEDAVALDRFLGSTRSLRGEFQRMRGETTGAQAKAYEAALTRVNAAIRRAEAMQKALDALQKRLDALLAEIEAEPVIDCLGKDPLKDAVRTSGQDLGGAIPSVTTGDFQPAPPLPARFCSEEEKNAFIVRAAEAISKANRNLSNWEARLIAVSDAQRQGKGDAAALQRAREEARTELARWRAIAQAASDAFNAALAIPVVDCSGETKVGLVDPGQTGELLGALGAIGGAIGGNPSADNEQGQIWPTGGDHGAFDGSEAERALHDRLTEAERTRHVRGPEHQRPSERPETTPSGPTEPERWVEPARPEPPLTPSQPREPELLVDPAPPPAPPVELFPTPVREEQPVRPSTPGHLDIDPTPIEVQPPLSPPSDEEEGPESINRFNPLMTDVVMAPLPTGPVTFTAYTTAPARPTGGMIEVVPPPLETEVGRGQPAPGALSSALMEAMSAK